MMLTKEQCLKVAGKSSSFTQLINIFLFDLVLNEIVSFDDLNIREKKSLVQILEGNNKTFRYDRIQKKISFRKSEGVE